MIINNLINNYIKNKISTIDIIINDLSTYPKDLIREIMVKDFKIVDFKNYFRNSYYNVVGVHFTRLFDYEISNININGLHSDDTSDYKAKINLMPKKYDEYKNDLLNYISKQENKRSKGAVYFDVGNVCITDDNRIFLENWGGETLYSYYDNPYCENEDIKKLKWMLKADTCPCAVVLRVKANQFFEYFPDTETLIDCIKKGCISEYVNEHLMDKNSVNVLNIIPINSITN